MGPAPVGRRSLFRGSLLAASALGPPALASPAGGTTRSRSAGLTMRWFGTAGWEFAFAGRRVLVDPWLTRFPCTGSGGAFDMSTPLSVDEPLLDKHVRPWICCS